MKTRKQKADRSQEKKLEKEESRDVGLVGFCLEASEQIAFVESPSHTCQFSYLSINSRRSSHRQDSEVLSQRSRVVSDEAAQTIGKAPILSNNGFELACEGSLNLFATRLLEPSLVGTDLRRLAYLCSELVLI